MYSLERLKPWPMRTLYYGVLLAMVTTLSLSFLVFRVISDRMEQRAFNPRFAQFDELQLESARAALKNGGQKALVDYLTNLDRIFSHSTHYLVDSHGIDLVTGENRAEMLPPTPSTSWRIQTHGH